MSADDRLPHFVAIGLLAKVFPLDLVEDVIDRTGARAQRERALPAQLTVYFTLALWLYVSSGYEYVMARLLEGLAWMRRGGGEPRVPRASSLARARDRLGPEPLHLLFERTAGPVGTPSTRGAFWRDRRLVSWDAVTLDVPDTPENDYTWGRPGGGSATSAPPRVQVFALAECGTQAVIDVTFGPCGIEEGQLARRLLRHLTPEMLLLGDLRSSDGELWAEAVNTGADLVWRVPTGSVPIGQHLPDGTYLAHLDQGPRSPDTTVRVVDYAMGDDHHDESESYSLATTLTDPETAPRMELARLYPARWDLRGALSIFAAGPRGNPQVKLRSTKPEGVAQELWALFCVHRAIRGFIAQAACSGRRTPVKISFNIR